MVEYFKSLGQSCKDLIANPVLFVPFLLQAVAVIVLIVLFVIIGLAAVLPQLGITFSMLDDTPALVSAFGAIAWTPQLIGTIVLAAVLLVIVLALVGAWFSGGALTMVNEVVEGRKASAAAFFQGARSLVWRLIGFWIISGLLFLVALLPAILFGALAFLSPGGRVVFIIHAVLCFLLFLAAALVLAVGLTFAPPILVREQAAAGETVRRSFRLLKERTGHVILTFLLILGTSLAVSIAFSLLFMPVTLAAQFRPESAALQAAGSVVSLLQNLLSLLVGIVLSLFQFRMYKESAQTPSSTPLVKVRK